MATTRKDNGPAEQEIEPLYWMRSSDTGNVYAVNSEVERGNLEAVGYGVTDKPKKDNTPPPPITTVP